MAVREGFAWKGAAVCRLRAHVPGAGGQEGGKPQNRFFWLSRAGFRSELRRLHSWASAPRSLRVRRLQPALKGWELRWSTKEHKTHDRAFFGGSPKAGPSGPGEHSLVQRGREAEHGRGNPDWRYEADRKIAPVRKAGNRPQTEFRIICGQNNPRMRRQDSTVHVSKASLLPLHGSSPPIASKRNFAERTAALAARIGTPRDPSLKRGVFSFSEIGGRS